MKTTFFHLFLFAVLGAVPRVSAQNDIPEAFTKRGFIQTIDYDKQRMLVNFIEEKRISKEIIFLKDAQIMRGNKSLVLTDIRSNDEVLVAGKHFPEAKRSEATTITLLTADSRDDAIDAGRIDCIQGDIAYVDGRRVNLVAPRDKKPIKGKKKTGYADQSFGGFDEIKNGIFADVSGKYENGMFRASSFVISPEKVTDYDKMAEAVDKEDYDRFLPLWNDKAKRSKWFGTEISGVGKIVNDAEVQEYVNTLGRRLVPPHIRKKTEFIFIVVENPDVNAVVYANGLAYVNTGLLKMMENEAQLAAVLGHEISHTIYEHGAKELSDQEKTEKKQTTANKAGKIASGAIVKVGNVFRKDKSDTDTRKTLVDETGTNAVAVTNSLFTRRLSVFSVTDELQADRVGLCLMALAGYDPREAPKVWKNIYAKYGKTSKSAGVTVSDYVLSELEKEEAEAKKEAAEKDSKKDAKKEKEKTPTKEESTVALAGETVNHFFKWQAQDNEAKSFETHPDALRRFEELNRLVALYWNGNDLLTKAIDGEKDYVAIRKKIERRSKK